MQQRFMFCCLLLLCAVAGVIGVSKLKGDKKQLVAEYEASTYNTDIYRGTLYSAQLCVASENISKDGLQPAGSYTEAAIFDIDHNTTEYAYNIHQKAYPASLTKLMTTLVAMENADLSDVVTVSANADSTTFAADEATCGILKGDQITLEDLIYGLLVHSGNDNAVAIAEHVGGSVETFAQMMNEKAAQIMATHSHFVNPNGLHDDNHYTTAYDMYLIFNQCLKHDKFVEIISADSYTADVVGADGVKRSLTWEPSNYYAQGLAAKPSKNKIVGGKTGTTLKAGNCLILLDESESGKSFVTIVMGAATKQLLYQNMTQLIESVE